MKTLRFHTGRGGKFNNSGHITFEGFETIQKTNAFTHLFFNNDNSILCSEDGNELDFAINKDGTGYLDEDGEYDSNHWVAEDDLTPDQVKALVKEIYGVHSAEIREILEKYYSEVL